MSSSDAKLRAVEVRLQGRAKRLTDGLAEEERRQAWLAFKALHRRPAGPPDAAREVSEEEALEGAVASLRAAREGDPQSLLAFARLVRAGYQAERDENLSGFTAGLDASARQEVAELAASAQLLRRAPPREAMAQALRLAYDRAHHPDARVRDESTRTLASVLRQIETSAALRIAVADLAEDQQRALDDLIAPGPVPGR